MLLYIHAYAVLGNGKGTLYEIIAARALGVTRAEVVETLALAALQGGPLSVNAVAEFADDYLADVARGRGRGRRLARRAGRPTPTASAPGSTSARTSSSRASSS